MTDTKGLIQAQELYKEMTGIDLEELKRIREKIKESGIFTEEEKTAVELAMCFLIADMIYQTQEELEEEEPAIYIKQKGRKWQQ